MTDIVIVNPSANADIIAKELRAFGNNVEKVYTDDMPIISANRVFYFFTGFNAYFTTEAQGELEKDDRSLLFKDNILARFRMWNINKALTELSPELSIGNIKDLLMFRRGMLLKSDENISGQRFADITSVVSKYPESKILSTYSNGNSYKLCRWETDLDLKVTLGKDYFVFFADNARIEAFVHDNSVVTLSKSKEHMSHLSSLISLLKKFSFNLIDEKSISINTNPWVLKSQPSNLHLFNDYSFGHTSISMQPTWYEKLTQLLFMDKKK